MQKQRRGVFAILKINENCLWNQIMKNFDFLPHWPIFEKGKVQKSKFFKIWFHRWNSLIFRIRKHLLLWFCDEKWSIYKYLIFWTSEALLCLVSQNIKDSLNFPLLGGKGLSTVAAPLNTAVKRVKIKVLDQVTIWKRFIFKRGYYCKIFLWRSKRLETFLS